MRNEKSRTNKSRSRYTNFTVGICMVGVLLVAGPARADVPTCLDPADSTSMVIPTGSTATLAPGTDGTLSPRVSFVLAQPDGQNFVNGRSLVFESAPPGSADPDIWANFTPTDINQNMEIDRMDLTGLQNDYRLLGVPVGSLSLSETPGTLYAGSWPLLGSQLGAFKTVYAYEYGISNTLSVAFTFPGFNNADSCDIAVNSNPGFVAGLAQDADGTFWLADSMGTVLYHVDPPAVAGGEATLIEPAYTASSLGANCITGIAIHGDSLWLSDVFGDGTPGSAAGQIVQVDKVNMVGVRSFLTTMPLSTGNQSVRYLPTDISVDAVSPAAGCTLWSNHAVSDQAPTIAAWDIPCYLPVAGGGGGGGGGAGGGGGSGGGSTPNDAMIVEMDIKPGNADNNINLSAAGALPIAILSRPFIDGATPAFDATTIDGDSIRLSGARVRLVGKGNRLQCSLKDVNNDGLMDMQCNIDNSALNILDPGEAIARLIGKTNGGKHFKASGHITIVNQ